MAMARHGLERFRELISPFRLPEDLYIRAVSCDGVPNAYFFREKDILTIRICYEYMKEIQDKLPKETTLQGIELQDAFIGQIVFALMHEFGHAAFDIFNVPIFGACGGRRGRVRHLYHAAVRRREGAPSGSGARLIRTSASSRS